MIRHPFRPVLLGALVCALLAGGCASLTHEHLGRDDAADRTSTGIRYLGTSPYLLAYSDGKGGMVVSKVLFLPDPAKKMATRLTSQLAEVGGTLEFDRGVLTSASATGDATTVPTAILKAVESLAPAALAAVLDDPDKAKGAPFIVPGPYLFKIVVDSGAPYLLGGPANTPIKITLLPQVKDKA